jgi:hypothetical protein
MHKRLEPDFGTPVFTIAATVPGPSFGNVNGVGKLTTVDAGAPAFVVNFEHCMDV